MFGYRNTSALLFCRGTLSKQGSETTQLGFYNLLDLVVERSPGLSREEVHRALRTYRERYIEQDCQAAERWQTEISLESLVKSRDLEMAATEKRHLEVAIAGARENYWRLLHNWLDEILPPPGQLDRLVYCGGASLFFAEQLEQYCCQFYGEMPVDSTAVLEAELLAALDLDEHAEFALMQEQLPRRLADAWGLFAYFSKYKPKSRYPEVGSGGGR